MHRKKCQWMCQTSADARQEAWSVKNRLFGSGAFSHFLSCAPSAPTCVVLCKGVADPLRTCPLISPLSWVPWMTATSSKSRSTTSQHRGRMVNSELGTR